MIKNYFLIAARRLRRDPLHSFINISSLSIGLAIVLLIGLWIFAVTGLGTLAITLLTVSYTAIKAATANPVKALRSE